MRDSYIVPAYFTPLDMIFGGYGFSGMHREAMTEPLCLDLFKEDKFWLLLVERRDEAGRRRDSCA